MSPFRRLLAYVFRYRRDFLIGLVCVVGAQSVALVAPLVLMRMLQTDPKRGATLVEELAKGDFNGLVDDVGRFMDTPEGRKVVAEFNKAFPRPHDDAVRLRISVTGGAALRLRLEVHPEALRLLPLFGAHGPD